MALKIDFYKNKVQGHKNFGKVFGRSESNKMIGIRGLAKHIAEHGSPYTKDVIAGVLSKIAACIKELTLGGTPVKIDDLCIFRANITSSPANDAEHFSLSQDEDGNIKNVHLTCTPTGDCARKNFTADAELGYSKTAQRIRMGELELSNVKGEYVVAGSNSGNSGGGNNSGWGDEPVVNP